LYLSKLEILGFKSFQQKTVVNFTHGMTGIVGPNGCGKTNIVDALRWSLGEQKSSTLRSDKMENVIFNGTNARKPMGMAEVSLTIQNDKGILPSEYTEVVITRRIFRSGESEYLLNKNLCRLKDITNLFMDTGMGTNAYSVIELKMVESILSNKADERRVMFEEAAGVNKYKMRRRLTLKKLDEVKADLSRVNDIITEVEKKVASLERQAKRADKHNKLSVTLRELELDLCEREFALFNELKSELKRQKDEAFSRKLEFESQINRLDDELRVVKEQLYEVERELHVQREKLSQKTEEIHQTQQTLSVSEERKKSLDRNIIRLTQEIDELINQLQNEKDNIEDAEFAIDDLTSRSEQKIAEKTELQNEVDSRKSGLEEKREKLKEYNEKVIAVHKEVSKKENTLQNLLATLKRVNTNIEKQNQAILALTGNIAKTVGFVEELTSEKVDIESKLREAESRFQQMQEDKQQLEKEFAALKERELEERAHLNAMREKMNFLQHVLESLEGFSKGAKALLEDGSWNKKDKNLLANIGNAGETYRFALEAALQNNLNSIIVETLEDIQNGIRFLESNDFGKASFYISGTGQERKLSFFDKIKEYGDKRAKKKMSQEEGFLGWCDDLIQTDENWKPLFSKLLNKFAVVKDLQTAFALYEKYGRYTYVTLNGDMIDQTGFIEGGAAPKVDETLFGRRHALDELRNTLPVREAALQKLHEEIEKLDEKIGSFDLKGMAEKSKILVNDLANIDKQIAQFEFEREKAQDEIEKNRTELQEMVNQSNQLDREREQMDLEVKGVKYRLLSLETEQKSFEESFRDLETEYSSFSARLGVVSVEIERLAGEKKNHENSIERSGQNILSIEKSLEKKRSDIESGKEEIAILSEVIEEKNDILNEQTFARDVLVEEEKQINARFGEVRQSINEQETEQQRVRKERERVTNDVHQCEIKMSENQMKTENLLDHVQENYNLKLELKEFDDLATFDFKTRTAEVTEYKQQIKNLGAVNLLAYSEYDEEKQRLDFLHKQRDDLFDSEKDLIKTINEINTTAQTLFLDTFSQIRENFIRIFRSLFNPGDEADLRLEENVDPLEAKIEIIAKPKGKRPTSIELLSGGEKTLTAIALLFSIYLVKPSPFCILDEIDAPLDDANIDRFSRIIKEFSQNTQFIVVTHNKRTMEASDALYGVTMQEEGVSKLVSVRFNEDMNIVA
jgi:chromosome segregation protein